MNEVAVSNRAACEKVGNSLDENTLKESSVYPSAETDKGDVTDAESAAMREIFARAPYIKSKADALLDGEHASATVAEGKSPAPAGLVPALAHSLSIIAYLNSITPERATLAEISTKFAISKSHCHGILRTLTYFDWVEFDPRLKTYRLQSGALSDVSSLLNSSVLSHVRTALINLVTRIDLPCVLSQPLADRSFVVIDTFRSRHFMQIIYPVGHRFPENACAQMRALLAWQPSQAIDEWMSKWKPVRYTSQTILDPVAVRAEIDATRRRGYSRSFCEFSENMIAFGLPIFDRMGKIIYIISCSALAGDSSIDERLVAAEMHAAIAEIHRATLAKLPSDFGKNGG